MFKIIAGLKGSGKTKLLISMVNASLDHTKGVVVCIEKGKVLTYDIKYQCRLINSEEYSIDNADALYGFVAGIMACNSDVTDIFIDQAYSICNRDMECFIMAVDKLSTLGEKNGINMVLAASVSPEELPEELKQYL